MTGFLLRGLIAFLAGLFVFVGSVGSMSNDAALAVAVATFLIAHACGWRRQPETTDG